MLSDVLAMIECAGAEWRSVGEDDGYRANCRDK